MATLHWSGVGKRLRFAFLLTSCVLVGELIGGFMANSLALLSDAGHVLTDVLALGLSWFGVKQAERPATPRMTFGYHRIGIVIAIINAMTLVVIAAVILYEAYHRLQKPEPVESLLMFGVATAGLLANLVVVSKLRAAQRQSLNVRSAFLHAVGDALSSVGVIIGGAIIFFTDWFLVDPAISIFIALIIIYGAWKIIREGVAILLEASPRHVDMNRLVQAMNEVSGVKNVHDLHVWSIAPGLHALSCHVLIDDQFLNERDSILTKLNKLLREHFNIGHSTLQFECPGCEPAALYCSLGDEGEMGESHNPGG